MFYYGAVVLVIRGNPIPDHAFFTVDCGHTYSLVVCYTHKHGLQQAKVQQCSTQVSAWVTAGVPA